MWKRVCDICDKPIGREGKSFLHIKENRNAKDYLNNYYVKKIKYEICTECFNHIIATIKEKEK